MASSYELFTAVVIFWSKYLSKANEKIKSEKIEINIDGTKNVLDAVSRSDSVSKFIFASSSEVYGEPLKNPISEDDTTQGKTLYAVSKLAGEELVKAYNYEFGNFDYTILRYFNTYGPNMRFDDGRVISNFIVQALRGDKLTLYGDGKQTRDFIHVSDVANTLISACSTIPERSYEIINLGTGKGTSVIDFASLLLQILKEECRPSESKIKHYPPRIGDIRESLADLTGLNKYADPETFLPFENGIRDLVQEELEKAYE